MEPTEDQDDNIYHPPTIKNSSSSSLRKFHPSGGRAARTLKKRRAVGRCAHPRRSPAPRRTRQAHAVRRKWRRRSAAAAPLPSTPARRRPGAHSGGRSGQETADPDGRRPIRSGGGKSRRRHITPSVPAVAVDAAPERSLRSRRGAVDKGWGWSRTGGGWRRGWRAGGAATRNPSSAIFFPRRGPSPFFPLRTRELVPIVDKVAAITPPPPTAATSSPAAAIAAELGPTTTFAAAHQSDTSNLLQSTVRQTISIYLPANKEMVTTLLHLEPALLQEVPSIWRPCRWPPTMSNC